MKNNVYPCKPQFYYIKVGFKGVNLIYACFRDAREIIKYDSIYLPFRLGLLLKETIFYLREIVFLNITS